MTADKCPEKPVNSEEKQGQCAWICKVDSFVKIKEAIAFCGFLTVSKNVHQHEPDKKNETICSDGK